MRIPVYIWFPSFCTLGLGFMQMNIPPLSRQVMALLDVDFGGLATLLSSMFWTHALAQIPAGIFLDKLGAQRSLYLSFALSLLGTLSPLLAPESLFLAILMRMVLGVSTAFLFLGAVKVLQVLAPPDRVPRAQGIQGACFCIGTMLPYAILPRLGEQAWFWAYCIPAGLSLLALISMRCLPQAPFAPSARPAPQARLAGCAQMLATTRKIIAFKPLWALGAFHGIAYAAMNNMGNWLPSILADQEGSGNADSWALATGALLFMAVFARAFGGELLRWLSRIQMVSAAIFGIAVSFLLMGISSLPLLSFSLGSILVLFSGITYGSLFSLTGTLVEPSSTGTAIGVMNLTANIANIGIILILGNGRELTGSFSTSFFIISLGSFAVWFWGSRLLQRSCPIGR